MGAVQILRVAVAALAVGAVAGVAQAKQQPEPGPAIAVIDLRGDEGAAARAQLELTLRAAELQVIGGDLGVALIGQDRDEAAALAALAEAQDGFGSLDCGRARPSAERAALLLTARIAAGFDERARVGKAWAYVALCAERDGDRSSASFAVDRLRALGQDGGALLPADAWARYPEIDAAIDRDIVEITVTGPAGSSAWIDDRAIGAVPAKAYVSAGKHVVAVAGADGRGALLTTAMGQPLSILVEYTGVDRGLGVLEVVRGWRVKKAVDVASLAPVMTRAKVELAVVIEPDGQLALWQQLPDGLRVVARGEAAAIATSAHDAWAAAHERAPVDDEPLLREEDVPSAKDGEKAPARWWVYAAIGGAIVAGAVVIYAIDAGEDRQRFELRF